MSKLQGKTALVTGASKGIGAGIAKEQAASGAAVVVSYATDRNGAQAVVTTVTTAGGRAVAIPPENGKPGRGEQPIINWNLSWQRQEVLVSISALTASTSGSENTRQNRESQHNSSMAQ